MAELKQIVGIRLSLEDIEYLRQIAKKKRTTLSGLIRERIFKDE